MCVYTNIPCDAPQHYVVLHLFLKVCYVGGATQRRLKVQTIKTSLDVEQQVCLTEGGAELHTG